MSDSTGFSWNDVLHPTKTEVLAAAGTATTIAVAGLGLWLSRGRGLKSTMTALEDTAKAARLGGVEGGLPALTHADTALPGTAEILQGDRHMQQPRITATSPDALKLLTDQRPETMATIDYSRLTSNPKLAALLGGKSAEMDTPVSAAEKSASQSRISPTTMDAGILTQETELARKLTAPTAEMDAKVANVPQQRGPRDVLNFVAPYKETGSIATSPPGGPVELTFISDDPYVNRHLSGYNFGVTARHYREINGTINDLESSYRNHDGFTFNVVDSHLPPNQQTVVAAQDHGGVWTNRMVFRRDLNVGFAHSMYNPRYEADFGMPDMPSRLQVWDFNTGKYTEFALSRDKYTDNEKYERAAQFMSGVPQNELPPIRELVHTFTRSTTTKDGIINGSVQTADDAIPYIRGVVDEYFTRSGTGTALDDIFGTILKDARRDRLRR